MFNILIIMFNIFGSLCKPTLLYHQVLSQVFLCHIVLVFIVLVFNRIAFLYIVWILFGMMISSIKNQSYFGNFLRRSKSLL